MALSHFLGFEYLGGYIIVVIALPYFKISRAKAELIKELNQELKRAAGTHKNVIKTWLKDIDTTLENKLIIKKNYLNKVKRFILEGYLKDCIEQKKTFKEILIY